MARHRWLIPILLLVAACQSETETTTAKAPAPAPEARDVCTLLTVDELNTAAGLKDAVGQSSKSGGADVCTWTDGTGKSVIVQVFPSTSSYDQARTSAAEEVTAVGDKAFFTPPGTLVVAKGTTTVSVQVTGGSGDPAIRKGEATAIAHVILPKV